MAYRKFRRGGFKKRAKSYGRKRSARKARPRRSRIPRGVRGNNMFTFRSLRTCAIVGDSASSLPSAITQPIDGSGGTFTSAFNPVGALQWNLEDAIGTTQLAAMLETFNEYKLVRTKITFTPAARTTEVVPISQTVVTAPGISDFTTQVTRGVLWRTLIDTSGPFPNGATVDGPRVKMHPTNRPWSRTMVPKHQVPTAVSAGAGTLINSAASRNRWFNLALATTEDVQHYGFAYNFSPNDGNTYAGAVAVQNGVNPTWVTWGTFTIESLWAFRKVK